MLEDPIHPIIRSPHEYSIVSLHFEIRQEDSEGFLDLELRRNEVVRKLRFFSPQNLKIEEGFPVTTGGMVILDVRGRQWDNIGVHVDNFEASPGRITFWARDVIELES